MPNQYGELTIPVTKGCGARFTIDRVGKGVDPATFAMPFSSSDQIYVLIDLKSGPGGCRPGRRRHCSKIGRTT